MKFENNSLYGNYSGRTTLVDEWQINFINALLYYFRKPYYCRQLVVEFIHLREYECVTYVLYTYVQLFTHEAVLLVQLIVSSKISLIGKNTG